MLTTFLNNKTQSSRAGYKGSQHFYVLYLDSVGKGLQHFTFVNDIATLMYQSLAVIMYNEPNLAKEEVFQPGSWT